MRTIMAAMATGFALWASEAGALELPEAYYGSTGIPCSVAPELLGLDSGMLGASDFVGSHTAADGLDSAFLIGFDNGRDDEIVIRRVEPDGSPDLPYERPSKMGPRDCQLYPCGKDYTKPCCCRSLQWRVFDTPLSARGSFGCKRGSFSIKN